jgi:hypothetical protein
MHTKVHAIVRAGGAGATECRLTLFVTNAGAPKQQEGWLADRRRAASVAARLRRHARGGGVALRSGGWRGSCGAGGALSALTECCPAGGQKTALQAALAHNSLPAFRLPAPGAPMPRARGAALHTARSAGSGSGSAGSTAGDAPSARRGDASDSRASAPASRRGALCAALSRGGGRAPAPARSGVFRVTFAYLLINVASVWCRSRGADDHGVGGAWLASPSALRHALPRLPGAALRAAAQAVCLTAAVWLLSAGCAHGLAKIARVAAALGSSGAADARGVGSQPLPAGAPSDDDDEEDACLAALLQARHAAPQHRHTATRVS